MFALDRNESLGGLGRWFSRVPGLGAMLVATALVGCGPYADYCFERTTCAGGNDADVAACEVEVRRAEELADAYGCGDAFDSYQSCVETTALCRDGAYAQPSDRCNVQTRDYDSCMK